AAIATGISATLWPALVHAVYGLFLVISYHIATIVGTPLDKAAIDLLFVYNATPGRTGRLFADSVVPYVTLAVVVEALLALALLVFLTIVAVPGLANGLLAVHTFGLERSPLTLLAASYLSEPVRALV